LSEDNIIEEKEKIGIYKNIIDNYKKDYEIFIKPHPREVTDYKEIFNNIIIFNKYFPLEILNYMEDNQFDLAVTLFSSAIDNITFASQKIKIGNSKKEWLNF